MLNQFIFNLIFYMRNYLDPVAISLSQNRLQSSSNLQSQENPFMYNVFREQGEKITVYYIPCFIRLSIDTITDIDLENRKANLVGALYFTLYYKGLNVNILDQFVDLEDFNFKTEDEQNGRKYEKKEKKSILLEFPQQVCQLNQEKDITCQIDQDHCQITFRIKKKIGCSLFGQHFLTPLDIINVLLTVNVRPVILNRKYNKGKTIIVKFNCLEAQDTIPITHQFKTEFGNYSIAPNLFQAQTNQDQSNSFKDIPFFNEEMQGYQIQKERSRNQHISSKNRKFFQCFEFYQFRIPLYRNPYGSFFSIFIPLWILGLLNLLVYFLEENLMARIGVIGILAIAYISLLPTIYNEIPQTSRIKFVQILILMEIAAFLLCLIDSFVNRNHDDDIIMQFNWKVDPFFLSSLAINLFTVVTVILLLAIHQLYWQNHYKKLKYSQEFDPSKKWENKRCAKLFQEYMKREFKKIEKLQ